MRNYQYIELARQADKVINKLDVNDFNSREFLKMHKKLESINAFSNYYFAKEYHSLYLKVIKPLL